MNELRGGLDSLKPLSRDAPSCSRQAGFDDTFVKDTIEAMGGWMRAEAR